jgi:hypothetical protein
MDTEQTKIHWELHYKIKGMDEKIHSEKVSPTTIDDPRRRRLGG